MSRLVHLENASFHEPGRGAVRDVHLSVEPGQLVVVVGGEGSGKTVLLRGVLGLVEAHAGSAALFDTPLDGLDHDALLALLSRCAFASSSAPLLSNQSLAHNVAVPLWMRGVDAEEARARVDDLLARLGLTEDAARRPDDALPRARDLALFARALALHADLLVLDDPPAAGAARDLIRERRAAGAGVLVATKDGTLFPDADVRLDL